MSLHSLLDRWTMRRHHGVYSEDADEIFCAVEPGELHPCAAYGNAHDRLTSA